MKVIYNNKEVANTTLNYNQLLNKPLLNSRELVGNVSLSDINVYDKSAVDNLIASTRSVKAVTSLPSPLVENTMYYVGPDADDNYHVYLVDSALTLIDLGMAKDAGLYKNGVAIDIDTDNKINVQLDYTTTSVNSEGKIEVPTLKGNKGANDTPVYLADGQITASNATIGSSATDAIKPIYMNNGKLTASAHTAGGTAKPVYVDSGTIKPISATVGSALQPVYIDNGTIVKAQSLYTTDGATTISGNTDLNTSVYTKPGRYLCATNASASTLSNCPTNKGFEMEVLNSNKTDEIVADAAQYQTRMRKIVDISSRI